MVRWALSALGSLKYVLHVAQSTSIIPVSPYTRHRSVLCPAEWRWWWETDFPATPGLQAFQPGLRAFPWRPGGYLWRPGRLGTVRSSSLGISRYLCHPPPVHSVHCGIEASRRRITDKAMTRSVNKMLGVGWLPHQPDSQYSFSICTKQTH